MYSRLGILLPVIKRDSGTMANAEWVPIRYTNINKVSNTQFRGKKLITVLIDQTWVKTAFIDSELFPIEYVDERWVPIGSIDYKWVPIDYVNGKIISLRCVDEIWNPVININGECARLRWINGKWFPCRCINGEWFPLELKGKEFAPITHIAGETVSVKDNDGQLVFVKHIQGERVPIGCINGEWVPVRHIRNILVSYGYKDAATGEISQIFGEGSIVSFVFLGMISIRLPQKRTCIQRSHLELKSLPYENAELCISKITKDAPYVCEGWEHLAGIEGEVVSVHYTEGEWIPTAYFDGDHIVQYLSARVDSEKIEEAGLDLRIDVDFDKIPFGPHNADTLYIPDTNGEWFLSGYTNEKHNANGSFEGEWVPIGPIDGEWVPIGRIGTIWGPVGYIGGDWAPIEHIDGKWVSIGEFGEDWCPVGCMEYKKDVDVEHRYSYLYILKKLKERDILRIGDHVALPRYITSKGGKVLYWHHAIVSGGKWSQGNYRVSVIGYNSRSPNALEEVSQAHIKDNVAKVREDEIPSMNIYRAEYHDDQHLYDDEQVLERAKERLNQTGYNLFTNNCEHFALWCKTGKRFSAQVYSAARYLYVILFSLILIGLYCLLWIPLQYSDCKKLWTCTLIERDSFNPIENILKQDESKVKCGCGVDCAYEYLPYFIVWAVLTTSVALKAKFDQDVLRKIPRENQQQLLWQNKCQEVGSVVGILIGSCVSTTLARTYYIGTEAISVICVLALIMGFLLRPVFKMIPQTVDQRTLIAIVLVIMVGLHIILYPIH